MGRDVARLCTAVSVGNADTALVAANPSRVQLTITNDGANVVYLKLQTTPGDTVAATGANGIRLSASGGQWVTNNYTGAVRAFALVGATNVCVTDI